MRPAEFIAVSLEEDGTGKVIASGNAGHCQLAADAANTKRTTGWCAVYGGLGWHSCGKMPGQEAMDRRRADHAASVDGLSNRISALLSRRDQANRDQVLNENSPERSTATSKRLDGELKAIAEEIRTTEAAHEKAVAAAIKVQRDRNEKAAAEFKAMIEGQGATEAATKAPAKATKAKRAKGAK
tara:strand:+ start:359 stop:910 length:552 start_codon:yes stop_codon:yes gene_type:complete